ncbi:hypothetical protein [Haliangium sp.]|uniref:hypothetical protein n=1 Tax=Haliangium sp. TaxID=2663208 RepID=UPI003D1185E5
MNRKSRVASTEYLQYYVVRSEVVGDFIHEVLEQNAVPARDWGKRDIICFPHNRIAYLAVRDEDELIAPLEHVVGERWMRVAPAPEQWDSSGTMGAPGVIVRTAPYWYKPAGDVEYSALASAPLERVPAESLPIALRRWLASRVAWELRRYDPSRCTTLAGVCAGLGFAPTQLSAATQAAIRGLIRSGWSAGFEPGLPGFEGPDEWYAG